jgi:hypothetical protein
MPKNTQRVRQLVVTDYITLGPYARIRKGVGNDYSEVEVSNLALLDSAIDSDYIDNLLANTSEDFTTVADLKSGSKPLNAEEFVRTKGYYAAGDYGGASYLIKELQDVKDDFDDQSFAPDELVNHSISGTTLVAMYRPDNHEWNINCVGAKTVSAEEAQAGNKFDSQPAIQALFDYLYYIQEPQGRKSVYALSNFSAAVVKCPIGSYYLDDELDCNIFSVNIEGSSISGNTEGTHVRGTVFNYMGPDGTQDAPKYVLKMRVRNPDDSPLGGEFDQTRGQSYVIKNMSFRATSTHGNQAWPTGVTYVSGIFTSTAHLAIIENCGFNDLYDGWFDAGHGLFNKIRNCWFYDIDRDGMTSVKNKVDFTTTLWIENSEIGNFGRYGINLDGGGSVGNALVILDVSIEGQKPNGIVNNPEHYYMGFSATNLLIQMGMNSRVEGLRSEDNKTKWDLHIAGGMLNLRDNNFSNSSTSNGDGNILLSRTGLRNTAFNDYKNTNGYADITDTRNATDSNASSGGAINWIELTGGHMWANRIVINGRAQDVFSASDPSIIQQDCTLLELPTAVTGDTTGTDNRWDDLRPQITHFNLITNNVRWGWSPVTDEDIGNFDVAQQIGNNEVIATGRAGAMAGKSAKKSLGTWWSTSRPSDTPITNYDGWAQNTLYVRTPRTQAESNLINQPMFFSNTSDGASNNKYFEFGVLSKTIVRYDLVGSPSAGTGIANRDDWVQGDRLYYKYPSPGGYVGVICTTGGQVGSGAVFKGFGEIEA